MSRLNGSNQNATRIRSHVVAKSKSIKHGRFGTPEYRAWNQMIQRCHNANNPMFRYYGGRGIHVCDRWRASFSDFFSDMGERPSARHSLDRKDNNGDYCPENCRWATRSQQARNTRVIPLLSFQGVSLCVADWADRLGFKKHTLHNRLVYGWSVEEALTTPEGSLRHHRRRAN